MKNKTYNKKKLLVVFVSALFLLLGLIGRLIYLMIFDAEYYQELAKDLHEREREIKAARGEIIDCNGTILATNKTVCTISSAHYCWNMKLYFKLHIQFNRGIRPIRTNL